MAYTVCTRCAKHRIVQVFSDDFLPILRQKLLTTTQLREKHWDIKWSKLRAAKVQKVELPDFDKLRREANMTPEEHRAERKRLGILPERTFNERGVLIASTGAIFEQYVPAEGDGLASLVSTKGTKQRFTEVEMKGKSLLQVRKIKKFEADFDAKQFAEQAMSIYVEAHKLLEDIKTNDDRLHELVTERAYPEMVWRLEKKSFRWSFVKSLEPPRVVHVRTQEMLTKENLYAQVTVRLFTRQTLAIYDRFGRLMFGSETMMKDCLEYIVFEKHLSDDYGTWRIHGKVVPEWMTGTQPALRTMRKPKFTPPVTDDEGTKAEPVVKDTDTSSSTQAAVVA